MNQWLFRCNICMDGKLYTSIEADKHKKATGHNSFKMVEVKDTEAGK